MTDRADEVAKKIIAWDVDDKDITNYDKYVIDEIASAIREQVKIERERCIAIVESLGVTTGLSAAKAIRGEK